MDAFLERMKLLYIRDTGTCPTHPHLCALLASERDAASLLETYLHQRPDGWIHRDIILFILGESQDWTPSFLEDWEQYKEWVASKVAYKDWVRQNSPITWLDRADQMMSAHDYHRESGQPPFGQFYRPIQDS